MYRMPEERTHQNRDADSKVLRLGSSNVARKGSSEKKQTWCVLTMRWGKGWQSREIKQRIET
jgi:hypothetical protein